MELRQLSPRVLIQFGWLREGWPLRLASSSLEEYRSGTDPRARESYLRIESISMSRQDVLIRFTAAAERSYSVLYHNIGETGPWSKLGDVDDSSVARPVELKDSVQQSNTARFYRLVTPALL